jgi:hypothetical protein
VEPAILCGAADYVGMRIGLCDRGGRILDGCSQAISMNALCQGTTSVVPNKAGRKLGL